MHTHNSQSVDQSNVLQSDDMLLCDKSIDWCWSTGEFSTIATFDFESNVTKSMKEKSETEREREKPVENSTTNELVVWFDIAGAVNTHFKFYWSRQALKIKEAEKNCSDWIPPSIIAVDDALKIDFYFI